MLKYYYISKTKQYVIVVYTQSKPLLCCLTVSSVIAIVNWLCTDNQTLTRVLCTVLQFSEDQTNKILHPVFTLK